MKHHIDSMQGIVRVFALALSLQVLGAGHNMVPAHASPRSTRVPRALVITERSIGPARLGMTVGSLKRAFPGSTVGTVDGPVQENSLDKNGREILRFNTREERAFNTRPISDSDIVSALVTSDPQFKTAGGIGPGSWLHNAQKLYGRPRLSFWSHGEDAIFPRLSRKMNFVIDAPRRSGDDGNLAGFYTRQEIQSLNGTTSRYRSGTKITSVGCFR